MKEVSGQGRRTSYAYSTRVAWLPEIYKAQAALRKSVPKAPPTTRSKPLLGRPSKCPSPEKLAAHRTAIAKVLTLHEQGVSIRGIRRRTGHSRNTIKRWLHGEIPKEMSEGELPTEWMLEEILGEGTSGSRNLLWEVRYIILRRPDHLTEKDREKLDFLSGRARSASRFDSCAASWKRSIRSSVTSAERDVPSKKRRNVTIAYRTALTTKS